LDNIDVDKIEKSTGDKLDRDDLTSLRFTALMRIILRR
jgi:hypothetical protein